MDYYEVIRGKKSLRSFKNSNSKENGLKYSNKSDKIKDKALS